MKQIHCFATVFLAVGLIALSTLCRAAGAPPVSGRAQLAPGDPIIVQVLGQPDSATVYVDDDGTIRLPLVGSVPVGGLSAADAAVQVEKALKSGGYFVDPHVTIVTPPRGQYVTVVGEVRGTARIPINPGTTILELVAQAGGLKETAGDVGYILRKDSNGATTRFPVNLSGLSDAKEGPPPPSLLGGDTLLVPPADHVFVTGAVMAPGKYPITPGMTLMQVLVRAGGISERGSEHRIEVKRLGKDGQYTVAKVKIGEPIQAEDVIKVKESIF